MTERIETQDDLAREFRRGVREGRFYAVTLFDEAMKMAGVSREDQDKIANAVYWLDARHRQEGNRMACL